MGKFQVIDHPLIQHKSGNDSRKELWDKGFPRSCQRNCYVNGL